MNVNILEYDKQIKSIASKVVNKNKPYRVYEKEDIVQTAYLLAIKLMNSYKEGKSSFRTYLNNYLEKHIERQLLCKQSLVNIPAYQLSAKDSIQLNDIVFLEEKDLAGLLVDNSGMDERIDKTILISKIKSKLQFLPNRQRQVIELKYLTIDNLITDNIIAIKLKCSNSNIARLRAEGINNLRKRLEDFNG